jgi:FHS family L-fucose permease-like MFS transporter
MSIMFPTIFVMALRGLGPLTKSGSAFIVMAIIGGAAFTALMGLISDKTHSIATAMLVPAGCFVVVALFSASHLRDRLER